MKQRNNRIKTGSRDTGPFVGPVVQIASPEIVEMVGVAGFDFVWLDCEHGSFYLDQLVHMLRAADAVGITPFVRVPDSTPSYISRVLDAGAMGVIVPNVETPEQVKSVVSACRYQSGENGGTRGACPGTRASWHQTMDWPSFVQEANRNISAWVLIENMQAVRNIDDILAVEGLDGVVLGPFDLAQAMGYQGQVHHPEVDAVMQGIVTKALARGVDVVASLFSGSPEAMSKERQQWTEMGVKIFSIGSDRRLIVNAMRDRVAAVHTGRPLSATPA